MNKEYKLNIDPRILELLGPSLYTNIYYVLAELIANAYDAMAHNVYIIANKDDITVEDDGTGMSYERGDINHYLNVAKESRVTEDEAWTTDRTRKKMGRKGVGKLAALSVSENVLVKTRVGDEVSGFVLSRHVDASNRLVPLAEDKITFQKITGNGSAIVMTNPQYRLHKTLSVVKKNLLKIFPAVSSDFRLHIIRGDNEEIVEDFDKNAMKDLCAVITLGDSFSFLSDLVLEEFPRRGDLIKNENLISIPLKLRDRNDVEHEYSLDIAGWIGTYKSTKGRKAEMTDFPDNFISLFANKKMGEFNILPIVGQNKLNEVYVVGQLHVDLFELTELPDMALSNRQGYKSDDPRYIALLDYVRSDLLAETLRLREVYTDIINADKKQRKLDEQKKKEDELRDANRSYQTGVVQRTGEGLARLGDNYSKEGILEVVKESLAEENKAIGLKREVDSAKKRVLISQTLLDKPFADIVYKMLLHNNIPCEDILYTNCDDELARIPEGMKVYSYLREFFVDSLSTQKIMVLFITSQNTKSSWGAITEVGAAWITQIDHKIFNIHPFRPEHPLDDELLWQTTQREASGDLWMLRLNADIFCQKIESVCDRLGYTKNNRSENMRFLGSLVTIRERL
jgi:Molecular chaperone, HSP90 family